MIVVDANVIAYLVIRGEHTESAERVASRDADWRAPRLWRSEMLNVLSGYIRNGTLSVDDAETLLRRTHLLIKGEITTDEPRVLQLVRDSHCSSYDCEYVAAAQTLDAPLVTADKKLLSSFPGTAVSMTGFVSS